jgi:hypothetical protein
LLEQQHDDIPLGLTFQGHFAAVEVFALITALGTNGDVGKPIPETVDDLRDL